MAAALVRLCVIAAMTSIVLACGTASDTGERTSAGEAAKSGTGELREDIEPLLTRFPVLDGIEQARWMSGRFGDPDNPGPSTYWIDAVVTLPADLAAQLRADHTPVRTGETPDVVAGLRDHLPPGPFQSSAALDGAIRHGRWVASAYLDEQTGQLVLVATGT